ncbi:MAG: hypothetical protein QM652_06910 [Legionella sp.]|uniref:hypothetical protein n=1 Tax=Legionella sp. TaxID=459 RepID=UPI0039E41674
MSGTNNKNKEKQSWLMAQFFIWIWDPIKAHCSWLFIKEFEIPENTSGELMRRTLNKKSWFDALCANWVEKTFWFKLKAGATLIIFASLLGILIGAPFLMAFFSAFGSVAAHFLIMAHEHHRYETAKCMAQEAIALNKDLTKLNQRVAEGAAHVEEMAEKLDKEKERVQETLQAVDQTVVEMGVRLKVQECDVSEVKQKNENIAQVDESIHHFSERYKSRQNAFFAKNFSLNHRMNNLEALLRDNRDEVTDVVDGDESYVMSA